MPRVSIITPTINRHRFLPGLWRCIRAQTVQDFEWLIHDGSARPWAKPDDPRIVYMHYPEAPWWTIGAKRNHLCSVAESTIIAHLDDDDYYAPNYLCAMLKLLSDAAFAKLTGFFVLHCRTNTLGYLDLEHHFPLHYRFDPDPNILVEPTFLRPPQPTDYWGYGFSYVYTKECWSKVYFPDLNFGEDIGFANVVLSYGWRTVHQRDRHGLCLHRIHDGNTSRAFPQQILPRGWLTLLFPNLEDQ